MVAVTCVTLEPEFSGFPFPAPLKDKKHPYMTVIDWFCTLYLFKWALIALGQVVTSCHFTFSFPFSISCSWYLPFGFEVLWNAHLLLLSSEHFPFLLWWPPSSFLHLTSPASPPLHIVGRLTLMMLFFCWSFTLESDLHYILPPPSLYLLFEDAVYVLFFFLNSLVFNILDPMCKS